MTTRIPFLAILCLSLIGATQAEENAPPGYNTPIPEVILTPDTIETRIGTLEFQDGRPTPETSQLVYDHLDFIRGVQVFLNFIPATSIEGIRRGSVSIGLDEAHKVAVFDELMDSVQD